MTLLTIMPWVLSGFTIYIAWQAGNKNKYAWVVGLLAQVLWFWWIMASKNYGLLGGNFMLTFVYARNFFVWSKA